jgi:hypothetical protein
LDVTNLAVQTPCEQLRKGQVAMHYNPDMLGASLSRRQIEKLPNAFGREIALSLIRDVVARCWITTPKEKQTLVEITGQVNRLVEEALKQLEEDLTEMGGQGPKRRA